MIEIDKILPRLDFSACENEQWIEFQFHDISGTVRNAAISLEAALYLSSAVESLMQHQPIQSAVLRGPEASQ